MKWIIPIVLILAVLMTACSKTPEQASTVQNTQNEFVPLDDVIPEEQSASIAICITEKGMIMYGTEWCPHCKAQKAMFGNSFSYINYVDCDLNPEACEVAGVKGYPSWYYDGKLHEGGKTWQQLKDLTGCTNEPPIGNETQ